MGENRKPAAEIKVGPILATVWGNEGKDGKPFYGFTFGRLYKDKGGNWQSNGRIRSVDRADAAKALSEAFDALAEFEGLKSSRPAKPVVAVQRKSAPQKRKPTLAETWIPTGYEQY